MDPRPSDGERRTRDPDDVFLEGDLLISPDGRNLGAPAPAGVAVWDVESGAVQRVIPTGHDPDDLSHFGLRWAWNGDLLAFADDSAAAISVVDADGEPLTRISSDNGVGSLTMSPDGTLLAVAGLDGGVRIWSLPDGRELRDVAILGDPDGQVECAYVPGGQLLISASHAQVPPQLWDPDASELLSSLEVESPYYRFEAAFQVGRATVMRHVSPDAYEFTIDVIDLTDSSTVQSFDIDAVARLTALDRMGRYLAWTAGEGNAAARRVVRILDLASGDGRDLEGSELSSEGVVWSPESMRLFSFNRRQGVLEWDVEAGRLARTLDLPG